MLNRICADQGGVCAEDAAKARKSGQENKKGGKIKTKVSTRILHFK